MFTCKGEALGRVASAEPEKLKVSSEKGEAMTDDNPAVPWETEVITSDDGFGNDPTSSREEIQVAGQGRIKETYGHNVW